MTREDLIKLCEDAVVPCSKWDNRDSYSAQVNIQDAYKGLTGGVPYKYDIEYGYTHTVSGYISIVFEKPTREQRKAFKHLEIDSLEDHIDWHEEQYGEDSGYEMFDSHPMNWKDDYLSVYIPTRERLIEANGNDWY